MVIILLLILGLCFGSFVNAFVWRFHAKAELADSQAAAAKPAKSPGSVSSRALTADDLSITKGRSMCVHCHHQLSAADLIPVVSYVWLRGKCRYCRKPIQDTPLTELLTPALFVGSYLAWPYGWNALGIFLFCGWLVFLVGFVMLAVYDLRWYELPHAIVLPLIGLAIAQTVVAATVFGGGWSLLARAGIGLLIGCGLFLLLYVISPKQTLDDGMKISTWIGGGDITLGALLGILVGGPGPAIVFIFLASLLGTVVALPMMAAGKAGRSSHVPFGPYLILSAILVTLFGERMIQFYTGLFAL